MSNEEESVLCFPENLLNKIGMFEGFNSNADKYVHTILSSKELKFIKRSLAENDPSWKQLIPYQIIKSSSTNQYFSYRRGAKGGEDRLKKKKSLGIGGHINDSDHKLKNYPITFASGRLRELEEEVKINQHTDHHLTGVIYDSSSPVGKVHFGVLFTINIDKSELEVLDPAIVEYEWKTKESLKSDYDEFERWSQLVIDNLAASPL